MRAIFLDRDGVLNDNVWYPDTGCWESPRTLAEFALAVGVLPSLAALQQAGYQLFLVSNQPNEANGKSPPGTLAAMHFRLLAILSGAGVYLENSYYCTHHPRITGPCGCRKPSPYFLHDAAKRYNLSLRDSWMIGDRVTDMQCGHAAGVRTGWVNTGQEPVIPSSSVATACPW
jgi:D-glycero-D-manno-heptose 1,7-bisphosphate phosphatase